MANQAINQESVDRAFCEAHCCTWHKNLEICGTLYAPEYRKGLCLLEKPTMKARHKEGG